jgi:hypothetical protein
MRTAILGLACLVLIALGAVLARRFFCRRPAPPPVPAADQFTWRPLGEAALSEADLDAQLRQLCSTCHVFPPADVEPKWLWPAKIEQMFGYIRSMPRWSASPYRPSTR